MKLSKEINRTCKSMPVKCFKIKPHTFHNIMQHYVSRLQMLSKNQQFYFHFLFPSIFSTEIIFLDRPGPYKRSIILQGTLL